MFSTSAAVLVVEILAARLLAPYVGVSLEVFTGIIGVILAGISVGAWIGGRAADTWPPSRIPGPLLIGGGVSTLAAPYVVDLIGPSLTNEPVPIVLGTFFGFFLPAALLSAVAPVVVKIRLSSLDETGSIVGAYSAIGTAGAIFGTFVTGFVLIASFPTRPVITIVGSALAIAGLGLSTRLTGGRLGAFALVIPLGAGLLLLDGPCEFETTYHCANVVPDDMRPSGRTLVLDRVRNSYVDLEDPTYLEFRYVQVIADVIDAATDDPGLTSLAIGGGGFTLPGYLEATRPQSTNIVLEIDPELVEIGAESLSLGDEIDVRVGDARIEIREIADGSVDVVIGDAYSGASVPWHLTTREYAGEVARVMDDDGVYVINIIDGGERRFVRAEARTLLEVFSEVILLAPQTYVSGDSGGNYILAASNEDLDVEDIATRIAERGGVETIYSGQDLVEFIDGAPVLTDDFAPVDQMLLASR